MGLMDALRSAQSSLAINAARSAAVASNVGRAGEEGYARRETPTTTDLTGARLTRVRRAHDRALEGAHLAARSSDAAARVRADAMDRLRGLHGGPDASLAPDAMIADLKTSLQRLAAEPGSDVVAGAAVTRARGLASAMNAIADGAAAVRTEADASIARDVEALRGLLDTFSELNGAVVQASRTGADGSDAADERARTLLAIADLVDVELRTRAHGDMVLLAGRGGAVLHETVPRPVRFDPSSTLGPTDGGAPLIIDGQRVSANAGGSIGAAFDVRDSLATDVAARADALAVTLVAAFQDAAGPGLFTGTGAADLTLNPDFDPDAGGDPLALRDGAPPIRNPGRHAGFADLVIERIEAIDAPRAFDPALGLGDPATLAAAAAAHLGQLERVRSETDGARAGAAAALDRALVARDDAVGVNVDEEMSALIEIEQSHRAAARIVAAVDAMLDDLFQAVR